LPLGNSKKLRRIDGVKNSWYRYSETDATGAILTGGDWEEDAFYETGLVEIQTIIEQIDKIAHDLPRKSALDFGCGIARLSFNLASRFD